jgi:thiol:disulfide interchange protein DsbA
MLQRLLVLAVLILVAPFAAAQTPAFVEGRDYLVIADGRPWQSDDKIEVVEVFGYSCIHCAHAAPVLAQWRTGLGADVRLTYVPAVFGGIWEAYARAYYTAETMGVMERTHDKLFEVLHTEKRPINSMDDVAAFYAEYGADKDTFLATLTSFPVNAKIEKAREIVPSWGVEGTPSMVVAGKYRVMSPGGDNGFEKMLQIVDFLVAQERAAKKKA